MLRLIVLFATHIVMLLAGLGMGLLVTRGRRQQATAHIRAAETREIFVDDILAGRRPARALTTTRLEPGRHRAAPDRNRVGPSSPHALTRAPRTSLLPNATLAEVEAHLVMEHARRETEHRAFESTLAAARSSWAVASRRTTRAPQLMPRWS